MNPVQLTVRRIHYRFSLRSQRETSNRISADQSVSKADQWLYAQSGLATSPSFLLSFWLESLRKTRRQSAAAAQLKPGCWL